MLVALDLAGITINVHIVRIRRDVSSHLRIPKDRVLVACTYTHASADLQGLWGGVSPEYTAHVRRRAVQPVISAAASTAIHQSKQPSSRAMMCFWISLVPSAIVAARMSR